MWRQIILLLIVIVSQFCYWARYYWVRIPVPPRSALLAHFLMFASRATFFFGGAFFSLNFFRHIPQLESFPPVGQTVFRVVALFALLFSLFCYSLELDRLGRAIEDSAT